MECHGQLKHPVFARCSVPCILTVLHNRFLCLMAWLLWQEGDNTSMLPASMPVDIEDETTGFRPIVRPPRQTPEICLRQRSRCQICGKIAARVAARMGFDRANPTPCCQLLAGTSNADGLLKEGACLYFYYVLLEGMKADEVRREIKEACTEFGKLVCVTAPRGCAGGNTGLFLV